MLISPSALPISHPVYLLHEQSYLLPHQRHRPSYLTVIPSPPPTPAAGDGRARKEEPQRRQRARGGAALAAARVGAAARVESSGGSSTCRSSTAPAAPAAALGGAASPGSLLPDLSDLLWCQDTACMYIPVASSTNAWRRNGSRDLEQRRRVALGGAADGHDAGCGRPDARSGRHDVESGRPDNYASNLCAIRTK
ncbi:hypothetical protein BRADI_2g25435v3 [Brachypodium distachyon]|uniref:Uncharacterized protein n=1 Tax=Brachypodium distachyon TaxID=15368 RepID=A0A0Q3G4L8_BRADI|nr:hypothetical protein BRADI_2g25435v3 [Brachypodium distachyon]